jgi:hypothetical protein
VTVTCNVQTSKGTSVAQLNDIDAILDTQYTTNHQPPTTNQQPTTNNQQPTANVWVNSAGGAIIQNVLAWGAAIGCPASL